MSTPTITAWAPGRVNLIGEHTDYTGGLVFPMAIDLGITIEGTRTDGRVHLRSDTHDGIVEFDLPADDPAAVEPSWGRFVAAVAAELAAETGIDGRVTSTLPAGSGLSSSAALEVAVAYALGASALTLGIGLPYVGQLGRDDERKTLGIAAGLALVVGLVGGGVAIAAPDQQVPVKR